MSAEKVYRMTLFKIPKSEDQDKLLEIYKGMPEKALKVRLNINRTSSPHYPVPIYPAPIPARLNQSGES